MHIEDFILDKRFSIRGLTIPEQLDKFSIDLSDSLAAVEEVLLSSYKQVIVSFVNASSEWYPVAWDAVIQWGLKMYKTRGEKFELVSIHVLFEQNDPTPVFGLEFNTDYDREHGCGVVMKGNFFEVIEVGEADKAYTWGA
jgi:hypothetical protein